MTIPSEILNQHIAVLGKTGSGKTSTAKLAIEQVVAAGARVCVLDPIKSDWWGLTSSADGKRAGLPFHILGGPHGHVPLHASAGKVIAEIVASGSLPLSIIDMADFEPGGQAKFFVDFAPALLRKMRGVVYLVIEEAHLFAPKERSGIGAENLSIHWAKTMATAGRSKGVRLVLVSQRTQALHNALLGSCDTLIAHRLTAPADQEPVIKWLKANTTRDVLEQVESSLSSLKTGEGWVCSGEARIFSRLSFPRIATYDNTATPTGDGETREVKTAPVDQDKLRSLIGAAADQAKADDPKELKKTVAELKATTARLTTELERAKAAPVAAKAAARSDDAKLATQEIRRLRSALEEAMKFIVKVKALDFSTDGVIDQEALNKAVGAVVGKIAGDVKSRIDAGLAEARSLRLRAERLDGSIQALLDSKIELAVTVEKQEPYKVQPVREPRTRPAASATGDTDEKLGRAERALLSAVASRDPKTSTKAQVAVLSGYSITSSSFANALGRLRSLGYVTGSSDALAMTDAGFAALGPIEPLPTGAALVRHWQGQLGKAEATLLHVIVNANGAGVEKADLADRSGYSETSSSFANAIGKLRTLELVTRGWPVHPSDDLQ